MAPNWLSVRVELLAGAPTGELWPPPGRLFVVGPGHTFRDLAAAIDDAFARWDRSHLCEFTLADGQRIGVPDPDDEREEGGDIPLTDYASRVVDETVVPGLEFRYVYDFGDRWVHRCTVASDAVDPVEVLGVRPDRPAPYAGWGAIPDQYARRWADDDGTALEPLPPADPDLMLARDWPRSTGGAGRIRPEELPDLRAAAGRRDPDGVRSLLCGRDAEALLQHAGDALLAVGVAALDDVARTVEQQLRRRDDEGDAELADVLAAHRNGAAPLLRPVMVDLDEVAELMSGDPRRDRGGWVDLHSGDVWPDETLDYADEDDRPDIDHEPDRWWHVDCEGSRATWRDRHDFASSLPSGPLRDRLLDALEGRGAFGRFSRVLGERPDVLAQWRAFGAERARGRARALLAAHGYTPAVGRGNGPAGR